jgi:hypothetical protein
LRERSGFALVLAVCLLAAVGSLAGAMLFAIREGQRTATRLANQEEAATEADTRLFALLGAWDAPARDSLRVGATDSTLTGQVGAAVGSQRVAGSYVTRVTDDLYLTTAVGRSGVGTSAEAQRRHSLLVRLLRPTLGVRAAIVSRGDVVMTGEAIAVGEDRPPPGWENCPPPDSTIAPSILVPDGRTARDAEGQPIADAGVDSLAGAPHTYAALGGVATTFLAERSDVALRAGVMVSPRPAAADKCGSGTDIASWGEPSRTAESPQCEPYFPVIHAAGDIVVTAGRGQGLLLVDGRLRIEGPFVFAGVILAGGGVETSGVGVSIYGTVLSGAAGGVRWSAAGRVQRSVCAVSRALAAAARPVSTGPRGWSELY